MEYFFLASHNIRAQKCRMLNYLQAVLSKVWMKGAISALTSELLVPFLYKLFIKALISSLKWFCELRGTVCPKVSRQYFLLNRIHRNASFSPLPHPLMPIHCGCRTAVPVNREGKSGIFLDDQLPFCLNLVPLVSDCLVFILSLLASLTNQNLTRVPCANTCKRIPLLTPTVWRYAKFPLWVGTLPFLHFFQCWIPAVLPAMATCCTDIICIYSLGENRVFMKGQIIRFLTLLVCRDQNLYC